MVKEILVRIHQEHFVGLTHLDHLSHLGTSCLSNSKQMVLKQPKDLRVFMTYVGIMYLIFIILQKLFSIIDITAADLTCGSEIFVESKGTFQSPYFPNYPSNIECTWILTAPQIFTLVVGFTTFQVNINCMHS